jgi:predicted PurR-regulated permease PerM
MVIIGVTIGGQLGGVLGMLVAVPLISIVKVLFEVFHSYLRSYSII